MQIQGWDLRRNYRRDRKSGAWYLEKYESVDGGPFNPRYLWTQTGGMVPSTTVLAARTEYTTLPRFIWNLIKQAFNHGYTSLR